MSKAPDRPVVLVVLDGWGYRAEREGNAIALADTPAWDAMWSHPSRTLLEASGLAVGLPEGQMGNSEVGHTNLGAGRVVMQDIVRIDQAVKDGSFFRNPEFLAACERVKQRGGTLHLMGLLGEGGVHAHDRHLRALLKLGDSIGMPRVALHLMLDGRDTMPRSSLGYMTRLLNELPPNAFVASVGGRYFGMDRDRRWPRTEKWYSASVLGNAPASADPLAVIRDSYDLDVTDEFVEPRTITDGDGKPLAPMRDGDVVICFNFRSDRMRQMVRAMSLPGFDGFDVSGRPQLEVVTMTMYDETFHLPVAFPPQSMARIVADVVSDAGRTMLRTAETEKYAHVTYFFNCGREAPFPGEERILIPSQQVATYDLKPEMSAPGITDVLCTAIESRSHDFMLCNFANGDMVGHTGSFSATLKAVETVDASLARIVAASERAGVRLIITADHGNCEMMIDPQSGGPHTAHTTNPVPLVILDPDERAQLRSGGALCDVGPTILSMLGLDRPGEMTGVDLRATGVTA
ncbi:MAG TPA: 2,3-bisphosphoglycerate-independent phosphoglycerate mutase [Gemmatimonadales bacterium]|nr:2,3-bisphosphoglycerate-independent phosphoglycerate mutase [Gemmatimonadales bacterium]